MKLVPLPREFYAGPPDQVAKSLLNKVLVAQDVSGRIVEVEAYAGAQDAASHAYKGQTERTKVMFGPPGFLYVYFTYGMHYCCNVVCEEEGTAAAVLIRALEPMSGSDVMRTRRQQSVSSASDHQLTSGPAKLCQALAIGRTHNGADLVTGRQGVAIYDDGTKPPARPGTGIRIGINKAIEVPWRFWVEGNRNVSRG